MSICLLILVIYNFPLLFSLTVYLLNLGIWPGEFSITWTLLIAYSRGSSTLSFVLWMSSKLLARYRGLLWLRFYLFDKTIRNSPLLSGGAWFKIISPLLKLYITLFIWSSFFRFFIKSSWEQYYCWKQVVPFILESQFF